MKKYLNALLCFAMLTFVSSQAAIIEPANARMSTMILGGSPESGTATCETLKDSETSSYSSNSFGKNVSRYSGTSFTTSSAYTCCRVDVNLYKYNSPTGTLTCYLYSDDDANSTPVNLGEGGGPLATSTNTIESEDLNATYHATDSWETFNFSGQALANGTKYWIVIYCSIGDDTNFVKWQYHNNESGWDVVYDTNAISWTNQADMQGLFRTYAE